MNWYHRTERRYVEYGSSFEATRAFGLFRSLYDTVYNMNMAHLSDEVETVFETLADHGVRTACTPFLIYRGRTRHEMGLEGLLRRVALAATFRHATWGPDELFYGELYSSRRVPCKPTLARPGTRDEYSACCGRELVDQRPLRLPALRPPRQRLSLAQVRARGPGGVDRARRRRVRRARRRRRRARPLPRRARGDRRRRPRPDGGRASARAGRGAGLATGACCSRTRATRSAPSSPSARRSRAGGVYVLGERPRRRAHPRRGPRAAARPRGRRPLRLARGRRRAAAARGRRRPAARRRLGGRRARRRGAALPSRADGRRSPRRRAGSSTATSRRSPASSPTAGFDSADLSRRPRAPLGGAHRAPRRARS